MSVASVAALRTAAGSGRAAQQVGLNGGRFLMMQRRELVTKAGIALAVSCSMATSSPASAKRQRLRSRAGGLAVQTGRVQLLDVAGPPDSLRRARRRAAHRAHPRLRGFRLPLEVQHPGAGEEVQGVRHRPAGVRLEREGAGGLRGHHLDGAGLRLPQGDRQGASRPRRQQPGRIHDAVRGHRGAGAGPGRRAPQLRRPVRRPQQAGHRAGGGRRGRGGQPAVQVRREAAQGGLPAGGARVPLLAVQAAGQSGESLEKRNVTRTRARFFFICHASRGFYEKTQIVVCLLQVYIDSSNVDEYLISSITAPTADPNAGEVYYRLMSRFMSNQSRYTLDRLLGKLSCPLLLLWGDLDPWVGPAKAARIQEFYADTAVVHLQAGHCPHDEAPEQANRALLEWLAAIDARAKPAGIGILCSRLQPLPRGADGREGPLAVAAALCSRLQRMRSQPAEPSLQTV